MCQSQLTMSSFARLLPLGTDETQPLAESVAAPTLARSPAPTPELTKASSVPPSPGEQKRIELLKELTPSVLRRVTRAIRIEGVTEC